MKYCLINCYSDNNKGDLGIILSTIDLLKEYDSTAEIFGVSTLNYSDPYFQSEHRILRKEIPVFPALFGELNIGKHKGPIAKNLRFLFDTCRLLLVLLSRGKLKLLNKHERETLEVIKSADYVVSKGGSFLCNENNVKSKLSLIRFLYIFIYIFSVLPNSKVVILCQSLGPVYGSVCTKLINYILRRCDRVVLREKKCLLNYPNIIVLKDKLLVNNDIAFHLRTKDIPLDLLDNTDQLKVGVTIKTMASAINSTYQKMMKNGIEYMIRKYNAIVYIYPHVTVEDDLEASFKVYQCIQDRWKKNIRLFTNNYNSKELKYIYGKMDFFVSSRLHSAIFALGESVPAIVIAYHGTKAQGVYENMNLKEWVVENYDIDSLLPIIDDMVEKHEVISKSLSLKIQKDHVDLLNSFQMVFQR